MITRQQALVAGLTQYDGRACFRCNTTGRYTSNGGCVACAAAKAAENRKRTPGAEARDLAQAARYKAEQTGQLTFEGRPCKHCLSTTRYTTNAGCVMCSRERSWRTREARAALYHSDTSPIICIQAPPAPELQYLYALCPALAAYGGNIHMVYSDAQHLMHNERLYPGCDVLKRPAALAIMLNDKTHPGHELARHLIPAYYPALRRFNLKVRRLPEEAPEVGIINAQPRY